MATKPPAVALNREVGGGSGEEVHPGGWAQVLTTPTRLPAKREVGPAAALLREAGSRQLGWEAFEVAGVCGDKQPPIIKDISSEQLQTISSWLSASQKVHPLETSQAVHVELYPERLHYCQEFF